MAAYEILPETNLRMEDIRDTLNANGGKVSNELASFFTPSANIQMWAKFKPVRKGDDFTDMSFYKAEDGNCGFAIKSTTHPALIEELLDGEMNGWEYQLPRGKEYNEPFRLGDFRKYNPTAERMFFDYEVPSKVNASTVLSVQIVVAQDSSSDRTYLIPADLEIGNCYFGAYIAGTNANFVKTSANTIGSGSGSVSFDISELSSTATYTVYPFLCTRKIETQTKVLVEGTYYTIPYTSAKSFTVTSETITVNISDGGCVVREGSDIADYYFTIKNGTPETPISDVYITIKNSEGVIVKQELLNNGGSIGVVGTDGKFTYGGSIAVPQAVIDDMYGTCHVSCNHGDIGISTSIPIDFVQPMRFLKI